MITTISELISTKFGPSGLPAYEEIASLGKLHDLWFVGGTAREMLSPTGRPLKDIDILVNTAVRTDLFSAQPVLMVGGTSNGQGYRKEVAGVSLGIFENEIFRWLNGVPCFGDQVAISHSTGQVLTGLEFLTALLPETRNPNWNGPEEYFVAHAAHVAEFRAPRARLLSVLYNR